ncbi:unnamed protein product [Ixodes pacificus]
MITMPPSDTKRIYVLFFFYDAVASLKVVKIDIYIYIFFLLPFNSPVLTTFPMPYRLA